jgi:nucleoside-diphosphate-sugar epimerase
MNGGTSGMRILVAGMTGQVGQGLAEACQSAAGDAPQVVSVVRRRRRADAGGTGAIASQVVGDITLPGWGLGAELDGLGRIDAVVNLAGVTDWTASHARLDQVNLMGAMHGLALAQELRQRSGAPVAYLAASSVFVAGLATGNIPEDLLDGDADRTPYELSKWQAELALSRQAAASGTPVLIARVGGVVGHSVTGLTSRRSSLFQLLTPRRKGYTPIIPAQPGARVDMLPRDVIGETLLRLLGSARADRFAAWRGGVIAHLAAGESAPTLAAMLAILRGLDEGRDYSVPTIVPVPVSVLALASRGPTRYLRLSREAGNRLHGLRYICVDRVFERARLAGLTGGWLPSASVESMLRTTFGYPVSPPPAASAELPLGRFA